jgi:lysophospholipase L1-like esterase
VNDIGTATAGVEEIAAGYRQIAERAKGRGLCVYGATILPFEGHGYFKPEAESLRQSVNRFIRESGTFDAVIDFDSVLRDPARPSRLRAEAGSRDGLHPGPAGYRMMGDAVDLRLFAQPRR